MTYDFSEFLKKAGKQCTTRQDLAEKADQEILKMERHIRFMPPSLFQQQLYLKRLEGTLFAVENMRFKHKDPFNDALAELLEKLS